MDTLIKHFYRNQRMATFFPPFFPGESDVSEKLRTDYIGNNGSGLMAQMVETPFTVYDDGTKTEENQHAVETACGIYCENTSVEALLVAHRKLYFYKDSNVLHKKALPTWAVERSLRPYFTERKLLEAPKGNPLGADRIAKENQFIDKAINYFVEASGMGAWQKNNPVTEKVVKVIVLTDLKIAAHMEHNDNVMRIVASSHVKLHNQLFFSLALFDKETGVIDEQASFGNLIYTPSRVSKIPRRQAKDEEMKITFSEDSNNADETESILMKVIPIMMQGGATMTMTCKKPIATLPILMRVVL